jgi:hypothetical protein
MPTDATTGAVFTIAETTGANRTVVLSARALPYRPYTLEGTQRLEVTWYPGSPEGTGTVLGAGEEPTTINGMWKDLFLSAGANGGGTNLAPIVVNGTQVSTAKNACKLFDDIRRQGQELEVTWDELTRRGYLKSFRQEWHTLHDVAWTMTFDWISQGEPTTPVALDGGSTSDATAQLDAQTNALNAAAVPPFAVPSGFTDALTTALQLVSNAVDNAANATGVQNTGATAPGDAARRVFASCNDVVNGAQAVVATYDTQPARTLVTGGDPAAAPLAQLPFGQIVAAEAYSRAAQSAARTLQRTAAIQRAALARTLQSTLIGVWQASDGDDLRDVAAVFYGSRLQWRQLLLFNELGGTALTRGQLVLVPRDTSGAAS